MFRILMKYSLNSAYSHISLRYLHTPRVMSNLERRAGFGLQTEFPKTHERKNARKIFHSLNSHSRGHLTTSSSRTILLFFSRLELTESPSCGFLASRLCHCSANSSRNSEHERRKLYPRDRLQRRNRELF